MDYHLEDFRVLGSTKPILKCLKFAKTHIDRESCGLFVYKDYKTDYEFLSLTNENKVYKDYFSINNNLFSEHFIKGNIISLFHTHIDYDEQPSDLDIEISESLGLPSYIFSLLTNESFLYYPKSFKPQSLENRIFIPFFQDCISFVRDYYFAHFRLKLQNDIFNWSRKRYDSNDFLINNVKKYFSEVIISDVQNGDLVILKPSFNNLFHIGVFDQGKYLHHHKIMHYPTRDLFTEELKNQVYKVYRYKGL
jgi:proteasome lid subunit RPN8/RPN11